MSTSNKIKISYKWDRENLEKSFEKSYTYHYKNSMRRYVGWLFIAMAQFGVVFALKGNHIGLLLFSTILIIYWYLIKKWLVKRRVVRDFENSPYKDKAIEMYVDDSGIMQEGELIPWESINGIVVADDAFMIYQKGKEYYLPPKSFEDFEQKSQFKSIAKEKGKLYV
ncbi:MAG: hypothetical protein DSZ06_00505 [Sulfurospirillum sp.]|nr:MAG: hypothetical protein DSZ06_00505 [Sulfurospirillum sp.]